MKFRTAKTLIALSALALSCGSAFAGKEGTVTVSGNVDQHTTVMGVMNTSATGINTTARTNIGVISDVRINGNVDQNVIVLGGVNTSALGFGSHAETTIGGITNSRIDGSIDQTIAVGFTSTTANMPGSHAETRIGVVDDAVLDGNRSQTIVVGQVITDTGFSNSARTCIGTMSKVGNQRVTMLGARNIGGKFNRNNEGGC